MNIVDKWVAENEANPDAAWEVNHFKMNRDYFAKQLEDGVAHHSCTKCGRPQFDHVDGYGKLRDAGICQTCEFWDTRLADPRILIINGEGYIDGGNVARKDTRYLGHGGRKFTYRRLPDGETVTTNNMWFSGRVPTRLGVADNAEWSAAL